ncbi:MAG: hypothetical protein M3378_07820 [Actinomycetota bacterium]|nr:hypothetical protein [Actinomycetota bacterium]
MVSAMALTVMVGAGLVTGAPAQAAPRQPAGTITQYPVPDPAGEDPALIPTITAHPNGNIYFSTHIGGGPAARDTYVVRANVPRSRNQAVSFDWARVPQSTAFPQHPEGLTQHAHDVEVGPDGNLWVTTPHARPGPTGKPSDISVYTPDLQRIGCYSIQAPAGIGVFIPTMGLTTGPDGRIWGLDARFRRVFVINPSVPPDPDCSGNAVVGLERMPANLVQPGDYDAGDIFDLDPQANPDVIPGEAPYAGLVAGPDGNLWILARERGNETQGYVLRMSTSGVVTGQFAIPRTTDSRPGRITVGPDGALWFSEPNDAQIARIDPATGAITEINLPAGSNPRGVTTGGDGAIWFTSYDDAQTNNLSYIGRYDPATGQLTTFPLEPNVGADDITTAPDGTVWFAKRTAGGQIGRVEVCSGNMGRGRGGGVASCRAGGAQANR